MLAKAIATEAKAHFINITMGVVATLPLAVTPAVRGGGWVGVALGSPEPLGARKEIGLMRLDEGEDECFLISDLSQEQDFFSPLKNSIFLDPIFP